MSLEEMARCSQNRGLGSESEEWSHGFILSGQSFIVFLLFAVFYFLSFAHLCQRFVTELL